MTAEVRIIVLTVEGHPSILVSGAVPVRRAFVDQVAKSLYGKQADGTKHEWKILESPAAPAAVAIALPASAAKVE
jgi:hypothetical protein